MRRHGLRVRRVLRYDPHQRLVRVARAVWQRGTVGDGRGYSAALSLSLCRVPFDWHREWNAWFLVVAGVRLHYRRDWGCINV
jgi:hypothetical protein